MIAYSKRDSTNATSDTLYWDTWTEVDPSQIRLEPDFAWWDNLLDFMWGLFLHLVPQDGSKRKPPRDAGRHRRESRAPMLPHDCHGPIHYWSGYY